MMNLRMGTNVVVNKNGKAYGISVDYVDLKWGTASIGGYTFRMSDCKALEDSNVTISEYKGIDFVDEFLYGYANIAAM